MRFNQERGFSTEPTAPLLQDRWHRRIRVRSIQRMLQHYRELVEASDLITPHSLSHYFADSTLRRSGMPRAVPGGPWSQRLATIEVYTRATKRTCAKPWVRGRSGGTASRPTMKVGHPPGWLPIVGLRRPYWRFFSSVETRGGGDSTLKGGLQTA